jgi:putative transposase
VADGHRKASPGRQPGQLRLPHADPAAAVVTRRLELDDDSAINGRPMDMGRIDQAVAVDTTELWEVVNRSGNLHTFQVHGVQFQVIEQAGAPPPTLAGWKGSVFIPPASTTRLLVQPSMGSAGDCYDNAMVEAFWSRMQVELLDRHRWRTGVELANAIFEYLEIFHNRQRRHCSLGMLTPLEFENRSTVA